MLLNVVHSWSAIKATTEEKQHVMQFKWNAQRQETNEFKHTREYFWNDIME